MTGVPLYEASVLFAALVGAAGLALSLLAWLPFRGSPFGRAILLLAGFMLLLAVYHPVMLLFPAHTVSAMVLESVAFALLAAFGVVTARQHYRMSRRGGGA